MIGDIPEGCTKKRWVCEVRRDGLVGKSLACRLWGDGVWAQLRRFAHNEAQRNNPNLVGTRGRHILTSDGRVPARNDRGASSSSPNARRRALPACRYPAFSRSTQQWRITDYLKKHRFPRRSAESGF